LWRTNENVPRNGKGKKYTHYSANRRFQSCIII
jgi:hypothetical protein